MSKKQIIGLALIGIAALVAGYYYVWLPARRRQAQAAQDASFLQTHQENEYVLRQAATNIPDLLTQQESTYSQLTTLADKALREVQDSKFYLR